MLPPAVRTVSATPPGISSAVARVAASPMTSTRYGDVSTVPAMDTPRPSASSSNQVEATTPDLADLDRLGARVTELLHGVEQDRRGDRSPAVLERHPDSRADRGHGARQDREGVRPRPRGGEPLLLAAREQPVARGLEGALLGLQPDLPLGEVVEHPDDLVLARRGEQARLRGRLGRGHASEAEPDEQQADDELLHRRARRQRGPQVRVRCAPPGPRRRPGLRCSRRSCGLRP